MLAGETQTQGANWTEPNRKYLRSWHASATPLLSTSVVNRLNSISTAAISATLAARRIVAALTSLSPMPPILPSLTSSASAATLVSIGTLGSTRACSNTSIFLVPSSTRTASSTDARMPSGLPCGVLVVRS